MEMQFANIEDERARSIKISNKNQMLTFQHISKAMSDWQKNEDFLKKGSANSERSDMPLWWRLTL